MSKSTTAGSTPRLSEVARHVVYPPDIVTTAWPRVEAKCAEMGVRFDSWQQAVGTLALGKRADGKYAATVGGVVLSIPRQVGKTFLVGMVLIALCVLFPNLTVLWTAHRTRTATKTFQTMQGMVRRKKIRPHLADTRSEGIRTTNGEQEIRFRNGSVIMFGAREQGFGRGFDQVDVEVFDEAQILTEKALEDMVPAANQSQHEAGALLFFMGTPPRPSDPGDEFTNRRRRALSGKAQNMVYIEFAADPDADPDDQKQWAKANPSFPRRTPIEAMERMREQLTDEDSFRREALGIWDEESAAGEIPRWAELADPANPKTGYPGSSVESHAKWSLVLSPVELGSQWASFGLAGRRADGRYHVEALDHRAGTWWVVERAKEIYAAKRIPVRMRSSGAESGLIQTLREAGVEVEEVSANEASRSFGAFVAACGFDDDGNPRLHHLSDPDLNKAVRRAKKRTSANGSSSWDEIKSGGEITPLVAVTVALGGVPQPVVAAGGFYDLDEFGGDADGWED